MERNKRRDRVSLSASLRVAYGKNIQRERKTKQSLYKSSFVSSVINRQGHNYFLGESSKPIPIKGDQKQQKTQKSQQKSHRFFKNLAI